jgi:hypothetical protein
MSGHGDHACACGGNCGCQQEQVEGQGQVYLTKEEYIVELEKYLMRLNEEVQSVEAELSKLKQPA